MSDELRLYPWQSKFFRDQHQNRVVLAGRRSGKTVLFSVLTYAAALAKPQSEILVCCQTIAQSKDLYWRKFTNLIDPLFHPSIVQSVNNQDRIIELINGSRITVTGVENPEALLGRSLDLLLCDEYQGFRPDIHPIILAPMLTDRQGKAVFSGTARRGSPLQEYYEKGLDPNNKYWKSFLVTTEESGSPAGSPEALAQARESMSRDQYLQEYFAIPYADSGYVYPEFDTGNIFTDYIDINNEVLHIAVDFNISCMNALVAIKRGNEIYFIDEISLTQRDANTHSMVTEIKRRYPNRKIVIYPDASGRNRNTSSIDVNNTNHQVLRQAGFNLVFDHRGNPPIEDRTILVNSKILAASGKRTLFVHEKCKKFIGNLRIRVYKNNLPEKDGVTDHLCDCMDYVCYSLFSNRNKTSQHSIY